MRESPPPLSRIRLLRILGLPDDAGSGEIASSAARLSTRLRSRLEDSTGSEAEALRREIADLEQSVFFHAPDGPSPLSESLARKRAGLVAALLGLILMILLLSLYAAGYRVVRVSDEPPAMIPTRPARLVLDGPLPNATLRVLDADREELFVKGPAEGTDLELDPGRYAIEVHREDCPDRWTRSVYFEEGSVHRFEPELCKGEGQLTVRSNVSADRLVIDGLDVGPTGKAPHALGVGDHEIRVEKKGYRPFVGRVRIKPGEGLAIRAELAPETGHSGASPKHPLPIEKLPPTRTPATTVRPEPFDTSDLRHEIEKPDLGLADATGLFGRVGPLVPEATGGGSTAWHDRTRAELLSRFDLDHSGSIDRHEESEAIPCAVWRRIEREFDGGGLGLTMARYFGFDGSEWHPNALGFSRAHRAAVYEQMKACGLKE